MLRAALDNKAITETEYKTQEKLLTDQSNKAKGETIALLLAMGEEGAEEIEARLREYADSFVDMTGGEVPISESEMLNSVFDLSLSKPLPDSLVNTLEKLADEYPILSDLDAEVDEHFIPEPGWKPEE